MYIDAEKLKAEIERWSDGKLALSLLIEIKELITSLQQEQPEVDLEKELDKFYGMYRKDGKTYDIEDNQECVDWKETCNPYFEIAFARHFWNKGYNARKEE